MFSHSKLGTFGQTSVTCKDSLKICSLMSVFDHMGSLKEVSFSMHCLFYNVTSSSAARRLIKKHVLTAVEEMAIR